jgi:AcrR family transcriptional regulator
MAYHHGDLRRALLQGALELLDEGGPAHLTLRAVAGRAGVSEAAPYRHFADKREMLAALAEEGFLALARAGDDAAAQGKGDDAVEDFRRRGLAYVRFAVENPARYRVMFGPEISDKSAYEGLHLASLAAYEGLRSAVRRCAEAGFFGEDELEVRAMRAWSLVHGLASLFLDGQLGGNRDEAARREFLARVGEVLGLEARILENGSNGLSRRGGPAV